MPPDVAKMTPGTYFRPWPGIITTKLENILDFGMNKQYQCIIIVVVWANTLAPFSKGGGTPISPPFSITHKKMTPIMRPFNAIFTPFLSIYSEIILTFLIHLF
jgi:hypothetical protein